MDVIKEGECHKKFTLKFELQLLGEFLIEPLREEKKKSQGKVFIQKWQRAEDVGIWFAICWDECIDILTRWSDLTDG